MRRDRKAERLERVLRVFLDLPDRQLYGLDVNDLARLPLGTIYPELAQLELDGWITSDWDPAPLPPGRQYRRRLYWLNPNRPTREEVPTDGQ